MILNTKAAIAMTSTLGFLGSIAQVDWGEFAKACPIGIAMIAMTVLFLRYMRDRDKLFSDALDKNASAVTSLMQAIDKFKWEK